MNNLIVHEKEHDPSFPHAMRSHSFDQSSSNHHSFPSRRSTSGKAVESDPSGSKFAAGSQSSVVSIYHVGIAGTTCLATVTWCKSLINHSLTVSVEKPNNDENANMVHTFKLELKPWPFWTKKGFKPLEIGGRRVDVFWDFRSAKFGSGPEPLSGYYVAFVCYEEVILLLGECKKEAYKKTKCRPSLFDAILVSKRENVFGKKCFSTRVRFDERKRAHDIVVENSSMSAGSKDPEMWISIDGIVLIHVSNLQWKFRGNETVLVEKVPVQVFWNVHDWLFGTPGNGHAVFIFKPGKVVVEKDEEEEDDDGCGGRGKDRSRSSTVTDGAQVAEFCFFLYAWKVE